MIFVYCLCRSIQASAKSDDLIERLRNINDHFTYSLYLNICRCGFQISDKCVVKADEMVSLFWFLTSGHFLTDVPPNLRVCRSLFEKDKLLFAFLLCTRIMMGQSMLEPGLYQFLLNGGLAHAPVRTPAHQ